MTVFVVEPRDLEPIARLLRGLEGRYFDFTKDELARLDTLIAAGPHSGAIRAIVRP